MNANPMDRLDKPHVVDPDRENVGRLVTGRRSVLRGWRLPPRCKHAADAVSKLFKVLEARVVELRGKITLTERLSLQRALRHEAHARVLQTFMRDRFDEMTADEVLSYSREIASATEKRDAVLADLNLEDRRSDDPFASLRALDFGADG